MTADHGELLGAHGGLRQKWYNGYQESLHVPFIISHPNLPNGGHRALHVPTSSVDLIPTMLGLANIKPEELYPLLRATHSEVHPLVGTDVSQLALGRASPETALLRPAYSLIEDHVTMGDTPVFVGARGKKSLLLVHHFEHDAVQGPTSVEVVVKYVAAAPGKTEATPALWKLVRYFDNPQLWSHPGVRHEEVMREGVHRRGKKQVRVAPLKDEYELYNLTEDPSETVNLAHPQTLATLAQGQEEAQRVRALLEGVLVEERTRKALKPKKPLAKKPHKKIPVYVTPSQAEDTLSEAINKLLGLFPNPAPDSFPYPKL